MFYGKARLIHQRKLVDGIFEMILDLPEIAQTAVPGQFVDLYTEDPSLLLPRPISICDTDPEKGTVRLIYAVVGKGTDHFSRFADGSMIRVSGPLGNGYPLEEANSPFVTEIYVVGGGLGVPPMLFLAKELYKRYPDKPIRIFNGFRSTPWIEADFEPYGEVFSASDDGASGFMGNVIDAMEYRQVMAKDMDHEGVLYSCGPVPMLKALQNWQTRYEMHSFFSLEARMGCGYGACAGCPVRLRVPGADGDGERLASVCKDGPVFNGEEVIFA